MDRMLLGNALGLVGSTLMSLAGMVKDKKRWLLVMFVQYVFLGSANFCLGAYAAVVTCVFGLAMTVLTMKQSFGTVLKVLFSVAETVLIVAANQAGPIGLLPVVPVLLVMWTVDVKNTVILKAAVASGMVLWALHDFHFGNYTTFCFDIVTFITNMVGIWRILRDRRRSAA